MPQEAKAQDCCMLFLPECFSFIGLSQDEVGYMVLPGACKQWAAEPGLCQNAEGQPLAP